MYSSTEQRMRLYGRIIIPMSNRNPPSRRRLVRVRCVRLLGTVRESKSKICEMAMGWLRCEEALRVKAKSDEIRKCR